MAEPMKIFGIPIDDDLKEKLSPKNWSMGTWILVVLFVAGIGWAYWQVRQVKPLKKDENAEITLMKFNMGLGSIKRQLDPEKNGRKQSDDMKKQLEIKVSAYQIPADEITRNPFAPPSAPAVAPPSNNGTKPPENETPPPPPPEKKAPPTSGLKLESVLAPNAIISGVLVSPGKIIQEWTVKEVLSDRVILIWEDKTFTLELESKLK